MLETVLGTVLGTVLEAVLETVLETVLVAVLGARYRPARQIARCKKISSAQKLFQNQKEQC